MPPASLRAEAEPRTVLDTSGVSALVYVAGDLFSAPPGSILVHACNTKGAWGSGIAAAFRKRYPRAFEVYRAHCKEQGAAALGTCLLIPGTDGRGHDIACLFTSRAYGRKKDGPEQILEATRSALADLVEKNVEGKGLHGWYVPHSTEKGLFLISRASKFNSGRFAVPWRETEQVLCELGIPMTVYTPVSDVS